MFAFTGYRTPTIQRLRLGAEAVYRLSPLPVPPEGTVSANEAVRYAAIGLLQDRAAAIDSHFKITDAHVPAVERGKPQDDRGRDDRGCSRYTPPHQAE